MSQLCPPQWQQALPKSVQHFFEPTIRTIFESQHHFQCLGKFLNNSWVGFGVWTKFSGLGLGFDEAKNPCAPLETFCTISINTKTKIPSADFLWVVLVALHGESFLRFWTRNTDGVDFFVVLGSVPPANSVFKFDDEGFIAVSFRLCHIWGDNLDSK